MLFFSYVVKYTKNISFIREKPSNLRSNLKSNLKSPVQQYVGRDFCFPGENFQIKKNVKYRFVFFVQFIKNMIFTTKFHFLIFKSSFFRNKKI